MISKLIQALVVSAFVASVIGGPGCNSDGDNSSSPLTGSAPSNLVASASNPSNGNGRLTATALLFVNDGATGFDEATLWQTVGDIAHVVTVKWKTGTHVISSASHAWDDPIHPLVRTGFVSCSGSPGTACDLAKITLDFASNTVTFNGLVMTSGGSATSTLTGTLVW
jgi:hypothetical protein